MLIEINITNKRATATGAPVIVCGNSDYEILFTFDNEWTLGAAKTARFVYVNSGAVGYIDVVFTGDTVAVPVLSDISEVRVGVFEGALRTTTPALIACEPSIRCGTGAPADPTPSQYDQIMDLLNSGGGGGGVAVETDPTVPSWAKQPSKPTYTADEVGAIPADELPNAVNEALAQAKASGEFDGADGYTPVKGVDYFDGQDGQPGAPGKDGHTPVKGVDYFDGEDGQPGKDGTSVTVKSVSESSADGGSNVVTFSDGKTLTVKNGSKGGTGEVDYTRLTEHNESETAHSDIRATLTTASDAAIQARKGVASAMSAIQQLQADVGALESKGVAWNDLTGKPFGDVSVKREIIPEMVMTPVDGAVTLDISLFTGNEQVLKIVFDGTEYICTNKNDGFYGNGVLFGEEDTGEPFLLMVVPDWGQAAIMFVDGGSHTVSISEVEYAKIDIAYLPVEADNSVIQLFTDGTYLYPTRDTTDASKRVTASQLKDYFLMGRNVWVVVTEPEYNSYKKIVEYCLPVYSGNNYVAVVYTKGTKVDEFGFYYSAEYTGS